MILAWLLILWVFGSLAVAMLLPRHQYLPGLVLLLAAPVLIAAIGVGHSWLLARAAWAASGSMFRKPLGDVAPRLRGKTPEPVQ